MNDKLKMNSYLNYDKNFGIVKFYCKGEKECNNNTAMNTNCNIEKFNKIVTNR